MSDVALLTAVYDGYDELRPLPEQVFLDPCRHLQAICVTDNPDLAADGWEIVYRPRPGVHPNRAAKLPKCRPTLFTDAWASVWVDASFRVTSPRFVDEALVYADPIAQFRHPWRDCIYDECSASVDIAKYAGEPLVLQTRSYLGANHPAHWGLWATGVIARRHTPEVVAFGEEWLDEIDAWTFHDQLSEAVVLRRRGLRPTDLPGDHLANPWLSIEPSARH